MLLSLSKQQSYVMPAPRPDSGNEYNQTYGVDLFIHALMRLTCQNFRTVIFDL